RSVRATWATRSPQHYESRAATRGVPLSKNMSATGHPIIVRRAEPADAEAIHETFLGPRAIAGTLQLPYPSVESWRKRIAEFPADQYLLVATIAGEDVGNLGLHDAEKSSLRIHVGCMGLAVRVAWHGVSVGVCWL